jgi:hypothetical protein
MRTIITIVGGFIGYVAASVVAALAVEPGPAYTSTVGAVVLVGIIIGAVVGWKATDPTKSKS